MSVKKIPDIQQKPFDAAASFEEMFFDPDYPAPLPSAILDACMQAVADAEGVDLTSPAARTHKFLEDGMKVAAQQRVHPDLQVRVGSAMLAVSVLQAAARLYRAGAPEFGVLAQDGLVTLCATLDAVRDAPLPEDFDMSVADMSPEIWFESEKYRLRTLALFEAQERLRDVRFGHHTMRDAFYETSLGFANVGEAGAYARTMIDLAHCAVDNPDSLKLVVTAVEDALRGYATMQPAPALTASLMMAATPSPLQKMAQAAFTDLWAMRINEANSDKRRQPMWNQLFNDIMGYCKRLCGADSDMHKIAEALLLERDEPCAVMAWRNQAYVFTSGCGSANGPVQLPKLPEPVSDAAFTASHSPAGCTLH